MVASHRLKETTSLLIYKQNKTLPMMKGAHGIARTPNSVRNNSSGNTASWIAAHRPREIRLVRHNLNVPSNHVTMGAIAAQWIGMLRNPKSTL